MFIFNSSLLHPFVDFCQSLSVSKDSFFLFYSIARSFSVFNRRFLRLSEYFSIRSFHFSFDTLLFTPLEFFTSVLADALSLEFEWQQVSSNLQDSSQYSDRSQ